MRKRRRRGCLPVLILVLVLVCGAAGLAAFFLAGEKGSSGGVAEEVSRRFRERGIPYEEVTIDTERLRDKFYYNQLSAEEKQVYAEILQGLEEEAPSIFLHSENGERANQILQSVLDDNPELFWCDGRAVSTTHLESLGRRSYVEMKPAYSYQGDQRASMEAQIEEAARGILEGAPQSGSDYEKVKYVYETIIGTVDYRLGAADSQNIYSALVNKVSVCAGYARSVQYLLERLGVFCTYVTGNASGSDGQTEYHAWNLVRCDERYYYVDATWGDPVFQHEDGQGPAALAMTYDYLCCSGRELFRTHTPDYPELLPDCSSEDLNYYRMNGCYYESFDRDEILGVLERSVEKQESAVVLKFDNEEVYRQARDTVIGELVGEAASYLGRLYGKQEVWYSYEEEDALCKLTIYWNYE